MNYYPPEHQTFLYITYSTTHKIMLNINLNMNCGKNARTEIYFNYILTSNSFEIKLKIMGPSIIQQQHHIKKILTR